MYLKMNTECKEKFVLITDSNIKKKRGLHRGKDGNVQVLEFNCDTEFRAVL